MHRAGKHKFNPKLRPDKVITALEGVPIRNDEVEGYCDEFFFSCMRAYSMTKMWGLANGDVGWANEPMDYVEAITVIESISNQVQQEEMDAMKAKHEASKPGAKKKG